MFKYGEAVIIVNDQFYDNAKGTIVSYSRATHEYTVKLKLGHFKDFFESNLKKTARKGRGVRK